MMNSTGVSKCQDAMQMAKDWEIVDNIIGTVLTRRLVILAQGKALRF
jgi:hypothetical protein